MATLLKEVYTLFLYNCFYNCRFKYKLENACFLLSLR